MHRLLRRVRKFFNDHRSRPLIEIFAGRRRLQLTDAKGETVHFRSPIEEPIDGTLQLRFSIHHNRLVKAEEALVEVRVTSVAKVGHEWACEGVMEDAPDYIIYLLERQFNEVQEDPDPDSLPPGVDLRGSDRRYRTFQVMSRDLRAYKAIALDLSLTGLRLRVLQEAPILGDQLTLTMDFDVHKLPAIEVHAEVIWWTRDEHETGYYTGLRFIDPPEETRTFIQRYLDYLEVLDREVQKGRVPVREMADPA